MSALIVYKDCRHITCGEETLYGYRHCLKHLCTWQKIKSEEIQSRPCYAYAARLQRCLRHMCRHSGCDLGAQHTSEYCSKHLCYICNEYSPLGSCACLSHKCLVTGCESPVRTIDDKYCIFHTCGTYGCYKYAPNGFSCPEHICLHSGCTHPRLAEDISYCFAHTCAWQGKPKEPYCHQHAKNGGGCCPEHTCSAPGCKNKALDGTKTCIHHR